MTKSWRVTPVLAAAALTCTLFGAVPATPGHAAVPACPSLNGTQLTQSQSFTPPGGHQIVVCSGRVRTFDGTPLHVDVSLPTVAYRPAGSNKPQPSPLVMFLSGWSNDVCQFESTTFSGTPVAGCSDYIKNPGYDWNNAWFASQGFVTLNYTPRGWFDSCGKDSSTGYSYASDPACTGGSFSDPGCGGASQQSWVHLYDRRWEVRDAQYLAGLIVDSGFVNPASGLGVNGGKVITTGDSGGGGPSWDLALSKDRVLEQCSTVSQLVTEPWMSSRGVGLHLAAAIPMYTWTDLVDSLVSNGTASDGFSGAPPDGNHHSPIGVAKQSYVAGLYALGQADAQYAAPGVDPDINAWYAEINGGEPYNSANFATIISEVGGQLRSPFAIPVLSGNLKPIFVIQGLTDPLFPSLQPLTEINRLKAANPAYPVWAFLGDVGHSYAQNPLDVWQQAHGESNAWLQTALVNRTPAQPAVTVDTTRCGSGQTLATFTSSSFGSIATSRLGFSSAPSQSTASSNVITAEGAESDPITNASFCNLAANTDANQATYTFPVPSASTLVGGPVVNVTAAVVGSSAELAARLWDVTPGGGQSVISRTVYRIEIGTSGTATLQLALELWPNAWQLQCGHLLRLELTQDDAPTWRPDNVASTMTLSNLSLSLPVVGGSSC